MFLEREELRMKIVQMCLCLAIIAGCQSNDGSSGSVTKLETQTDRVSYAIGLNVGTNMLRDSVKYEIGPFLQGLKDAALDSSRRMMTFAEVEQTLMSYQQELQTQAAERVRKQGEERLKIGKEFLEQNKTKPGIVVLPNGLQYNVVKKGSGAKPAPDDYITAHYRGRLVTGEEFDSSYERGEPVTFRTASVIKGWQELIPMMNVGSKWEFYIPAGLAYGESGSGPIGPNEALLFEFELLSTQKSAGPEYD